VGRYNDRLHDRLDPSGRQEDGDRQTTDRQYLQNPPASGVKFAHFKCPRFRPFSDHRDTAATTRSCPPGAARSFRPVDFSAIRDVFEVRREGGVPAADGGQFFPPGTFTDAFATADRVLHSGVACITDLIVKEGLIKFDFADVRAVMREMGSAMMGTGEASGDRRA
jgi:hypothetical protein